MFVRPIELANVCALFPSQKTGEILSDNLNKLIQYSSLIDCEIPPTIIVEEAINSGLISCKRNFYSLTSKGKAISKVHSKPSYRLSDQAAEVFIKNVFFKEDSNNWYCKEFILQLNPDIIVKSFIFPRDNSLIEDETRWLISLSSVGYIDVDTKKAVVNKRYLGITNELLLTIRNPIHTEIANIKEEKNAIGDCAEYLALQHEIDRLTDAGFESLVPLIQHISSIDQSAGYDIISYKGFKPDPEKNIFIEVKGTRKNQLNFYWSNNEISIAKEKINEYYIYGFTEVNPDASKGVGPVIIQNPVDNLKKMGYSIQALNCYVTST